MLQVDRIRAREVLPSPTDLGQGLVEISSGVFDAAKRLMHTGAVAGRYALGAVVHPSPTLSETDTAVIQRGIDASRRYPLANKQ